MKVEWVDIFAVASDPCPDDGADIVAVTCSWHDILHRIIIVLSILRQAMGTSKRRQARFWWQSPILTFFVGGLRH